MAPRDTDEKPRKKSKAGSILVFGLLALLIAGLAGFGVTNFGGGVTTIGSVGDRGITADDYARALRADLNAFSAQIGQPVSMQQGLQMGIDARVRQQLISAATLSNEADRAGLSAGNARVVAELVTIPAFQGPAGNFDRETYGFVLGRNGMTENAFETQLREDLARSVLVGAVAGGFAAPQVLTDTLFAHVAEQRAFTLMRLTERDLAAPPPAPTDAELRAYHSGNIAQFTTPEARRITYVTLLPADLAAGTEVGEPALRQAYDDRIAEFVQPERRLVERLAFADQAAADAARARLNMGETFDALVAERGLSLADIDMGDVALADLGAAGEAVFALPGPGIAGPLPSEFGPALYRMNAILAAEETTFEEARAGLTTELAADAARRAVAARREAVIDALAGGATLEDLAAEQQMTLATLDVAPGSDAAVLGYPDFREAALAAAEGDDPALIDLDDGGIAALRLDEIVPPEPQDFDAALPAVTLAWRQSAMTQALIARAETIAEAVKGGARLGTFGVAEVTPRITRDGFVEGAPPALMPALFEMAPGEARVVSEGDVVIVVALDAVMPADAADPDQATLRDTIAAQAQQALAQDALTLFTDALMAGTGITLNEAAIAAVHSQVQ